MVILHNMIEILIMALSNIYGYPSAALYVHTVHTT